MAEAREIGAKRGAAEIIQRRDLLIDLFVPRGVAHRPHRDFDGRQVVKTIKQESPATPIIMLTGWGSFMKEDGDMPSQVSGILTKPPRSNELKEMLRRVGENRG